MCVTWIIIVDSMYICIYLFSFLFIYLRASHPRLLAFLARSLLHFSRSIAINNPRGVIFKLPHIYTTRTGDTHLLRFIYFFIYFLSTTYLVCAQSQNMHWEKEI